MKLRHLVTILICVALNAKASVIPPVEGINSPYDESNPVISPDGKTLFVTIANHPENLGGKKDPGDIWISSLGADNKWSAPVHGGALLNDKAYNGVAGFSADGTELFLLTHYDPSGVAKTQGISVSRKGSQGWSRPENITIPYFQNKSNIISGYVSPDKKWFVYSAETYGTYGVEDIFICERGADGKWSPPKNVGPKINTQFQEVSPSLSFDGKTLYYSTNGRKGSGSFDIFSAARLDDTWTNWGDPVNLPALNSDGKELFYKEFPRLGFSIYTSTKNSDGYGDVKFHRPQEPQVLDSVVTQPVVETEPAVTPPVVIQERLPAAGAEHEISVFGKVIDSKTGEAIPARLTFTSSKGATPISVESTRNGFASRIKSLDQYGVRIEAKGYISAMEKLDVQTFEMSDLEMNFKLQPAEVGTTVNLKSVLFVQSKTTLLPESYAELDLVVSFLKENPNVKIELSGHTDNRGNPFQNTKLSQGRVDVVKDYLTSKGIDEKRITGKGYGGSKPIASNNEEETRKLNRRVEFTIQQN